MRTWLFLVALLAASVASAQGVLKGTVTTSHGEPLSGIDVRIAGRELSGRPVVTDVNGAFDMGRLPAGPYTVVIVRAPSDFRAKVRRDVTVPASGVVAVQLVLDRTFCLEADDGSGNLCMDEHGVAAIVPEPYRALWLGTVGPDQVWTSLPCDSIALTHGATMIFGTGATFQVTLARGGRAELSMLEDAKSPTRRSYVGSVDAWTFGRLCYLADRLAFGTLRPAYDANYTDGQGVVVTVRRNGEDRSVVADTGVAPIEIWALDQAIDNVRRQIEWKPAAAGKDAP